MLRCMLHMPCYTLQPWLCSVPMRGLNATTTNDKTADAAAAGQCPPPALFFLAGLLRCCKRRHGVLRLAGIQRLLLLYLQGRQYDTPSQRTFGRADGGRTMLRHAGSATATATGCTLPTPARRQDNASCYAEARIRSRTWSVSLSRLLAACADSRSLLLSSSGASSLSSSAMLGCRYCQLDGLRKANVSGL